MTAWGEAAERCAGKYVVLFFYPLDFTFVCPVRSLLPPRFTRIHSASLSGSRTSAQGLALTPSLSPPDGDLRLLRPRERVLEDWRAGSPPDTMAHLPPEHRARPRPASPYAPPHAPPAASQLIGVSIDSEYSHLAWSNTSRKDGGLGGCSFPLVADLNKSIASAYGVLDTESGVAYRCVRQGGAAGAR